MSMYMKSLRGKVGHDLLVLPSVAVVLSDNDGKVLFGRHSDKQVWVTPGGLVEPGEIPADAAIRETWEETGLFVEVTSILGVFGGDALVIHYPNGDVASYVGTIFRGRIIGGTLRADGTEILELRFLSPSELQGLPHAAWVDRALNAIFDDSIGPVFQPSTWQPRQ